MADASEHRGLRHSLVDVRFIAIVAMKSGADDAEAMEDFGVAHEEWVPRLGVRPTNRVDGGPRRDRRQDPPAQPRLGVGREIHPHGEQKANEIVALPERLR
ncbi:MAG: transposase family protein [Myxococcales bacterium]|nr:transposase family protein [Myxococcales bacterium]